MLQLPSRAILTCSTTRPMGTVLKTNLHQVLLEAGILSSPNQAFNSEPITSLLPSLNARPSLLDCHKLLTTSSEPTFRVMAATNGAGESTRGLFDLALGKEESEKWEVFSCNEIEVAKPAPAVYEAVWKRLGLEKKKDRSGWFIASHTW